MKIRCEMEMDYYQFMERFAELYTGEKDWADEYIRWHTNEEGHYDEMLTNIIMNAMEYKFYTFRFAFEKFVGENGKINPWVSMRNLVAFGLTLDYYGFDNFVIDNENEM